MISNHVPPIVTVGVIINIINIIIVIITIFIIITSNVVLLPSSSFSLYAPSTACSPPGRPEDNRQQKLTTMEFLEEKPTNYAAAERNMAASEIPCMAQNFRFVQVGLFE